MSSEGIALVYSIYFFTNYVWETIMTTYSKTIKHLLRLVTLQRKIYYLSETHPATVYTM